MSGLRDAATIAALACDLAVLRARVRGEYARAPLPETLGRLAKHRPPVLGDPRQIDAAIARLERLVTALYLPYDTCLYRSLARFGFLRGQRHPVRFVMGVHEDHGHAWLETDEGPTEDLEHPFTVTYRYP